MSFLDDLENNLKSLESSEQARDDKEREQRSRELERTRVQASAPFAEELKKGPYTAELLKQAARIGFSLRTKVNVVWLGTTLRLEAREKRLELRPTPQGIVAAYLDNGQEMRIEALDLHGNPEDLVRQWLHNS
jgi:hypothetical protein